MQIVEDVHVRLQQELREEEERDRTIEQRMLASTNLSYFLQMKIRNAEARLILIDHAVAQAERAAREEYRRAHPPRHLCAECQQSFSNHTALVLHERDKAFHKNYLRQQVTNDERFAAVNAILEGNRGRQFLAHRMIFHAELGRACQQARVDASRYDPFRPQLMDPQGKRSEQLLKGSLVCGFDPSRGIRPGYRKDGLIRQHLAPLRRAPNSDAFVQTIWPELNHVIRDLVRCQDDFIDIVSCQDHPNYALLAEQNRENLLAMVRFEWNGSAIREVFVKGEFTGWKCEEMRSDISTGQFYLMRELPPGRYKYRFMVDGVEMLDRISSRVADPVSPLGESNVLLVTIDPVVITSNEDEDSTTEGGKSVFSITTSQQPPGLITHISQMDKARLTKRLAAINLRNLSLYDDGVWALASYIRKNNLIQEVDLSFNDISDEGVQALAGCFEKLTALRLLKLNGNGFGYDGCRYLTDQAKHCKFLETLELGGNRLGDDGMEVLCQYLRYNPVLLELFVDGCYIGDDGMVALCDSLRINRTLSLISLTSNRITSVGAATLSAALAENAALLTLKLSHNRIGSDGTKAIGNALYTNDTLQEVYLADVNMLENRSAAGLHAICYALKRNRHLIHLSLAQNGLTDWHCADIAYALMANKALESLDMANNSIQAVWMVDKLIDTHIMKDMPTIAASLNKNKALKKLEHYDDDHKSHIEDNVQFGHWTKRRVWKKIDQDQEEKQRKQQAIALEYSRMQSEEEWIQRHLRERMNVVKYYLEEQPCRQYLQLVASHISRYLHELPYYDVDEHGLPALVQSSLTLQRHSPASLRLESIRLTKSKKSTVSSSRKWSSQSSRRFKSVRIAAFNNENENANAKKRWTLLPFFRSLGLSGGGKDVIESVPVFLHAHLSVLAAVFMTLEGGHPTLTLQPERLQQAMQVLALPLLPQDVQEVVNATIVKGIYKIAIHKLYEFLLRYGELLSEKNRFQRSRLLGDLFLRPPVLEAKAIIMQTLRRSIWTELRTAYRDDPLNKPLYLCTYCHKRFASQKLLDKHVKKGIGNDFHRRFALEEVIHHSQICFLATVKYDLVGVHFPAYFELLPSHLLPYEYYPQVVDKMGQGGRPIGVVEAFHTVKAIDALGDYLQVILHDQLGWVRYKEGKQFFLQPIAGFNWEELHVQEEATYYRVNDNLPAHIELKVRYRPALDAEVIGYLTSGQVIACLGKIDNWLQVRYENEDSAWVLLRPPASPSDGPVKVVVNNDALGPARGGDGRNKPRSPSPIRKRRIDPRATAVEVADEDEDQVFEDHIVTYEINLKKRRVNIKHHPEISKYKVMIFDRIRYGDPDNGSHRDHLLQLPDFACKDRRGCLHPIIKTGKGPWKVSQEQLFEMVMSYSEAGWREFDSQESGMAFLDDNPQSVLHFSSEVHKIHQLLAQTSLKKSKKVKKGSGLRGSVSSVRGFDEEDGEDRSLTELSLEDEEQVEALIYSHPDEERSLQGEDSLL